ncbi:DUF3667 domain-containing protein [Myroides marinus]|uniref:DUF3667 domain-containing protein n=1 Tax=Myroides marinus TaxID=703342 RepID=UPI000741B245|nr:DUF3667 domain-containing protein [Myroides marinus]KUF38189.1 hypothetical protein AS361_08045 [Myroides marinus]MDM1351987.1 DUF3667 domain-containing protein [Myroides marinus]MDM1359185.1 DUF3667 domain-containing protein [Myroides marinus]MDM1362640.1 DUF3667 domain-containing protein [Myroides marinus]MDM1405784.1 DUF3667 domain-containing protein [Myroides marinus]
MSDNCANCSQLVTENYCANCGQKRYSRIDKQYLLEELYEVLIYANKGFMYSVLKVAMNPGKTAREFLDGNRLKHYKPILLAFVLSGISAIISFQFIELEKAMRLIYSQQEVNNKLANELVAFSVSYNSFLMLLLIPFFALLTKICFNRWGQNYYEHIVMNAYILSFITIFNIVVFSPIAYYYKDSPTTVINIFMISLATTPIILIWFFKQFYKEHSLKSIILRLLLFIALGIVLYIALIILLIALGFFVAMLFGPELLQNIKP